jgi:phosphatidylglycerol:prolipoprotein diacylglycerol transferase
MYPIITKIGPFTLHTFGVMLAIAILVGSTFLVRETRRLGDPKIPEERMQRLIWYIVIAVIVGGRLMHVIVNWEYYMKRPAEIPAIWEGGLVMYGGLIAVFLTVVFFARKHKINVLRLCDLVAPSAFLGDAIGRWGCFFAGDDYGRRAPEGAWYAITFPAREGTLAPTDVPLYPTQIMMSLKAFIIFGVCLWITRRKKFDGQVAGIALMLYAVLRSVVEFFRGDEDRGYVFGGLMSTSQFISIFMFAVGVLLLWMAPRKTLADELKASADKADKGGKGGKGEKAAKPA